MKELYKHPRLYINVPFQENISLALAAEQAHYLKNVLRRSVGDALRVFNGVDGEWLGKIVDLGKKNGGFILMQRLKGQPKPGPKHHLLFAPIKKQRMDMLIEKAVELGVTDLHPVITNRTENRRLNEERIKAQVIEAAEQCERLDVPHLHSVHKLQEKIAQWEEGLVYAALERVDAPPLHAMNIAGASDFLIGPEGGFDEGELAFLSSNENIQPISLGENILRAETAALACLSYTHLKL